MKMNTKQHKGKKIQPTDMESLKATFASMRGASAQEEEEEEGMKRTMKGSNNRGDKQRIQRQQQYPQVRSFQVSPCNFMMTDEGRKHKGRR